MNNKNKKDLSEILSSDFQDAVVRMRLMMDVHIEYMKLKAKLQKEKYDALVEVGFTSEQALELCKDI